MVFTGQVEACLRTPGLQRRLVLQMWGPAGLEVPWCQHRQERRQRVRQVPQIGEGREMERDSEVN